MLAQDLGQYQTLIRQIASRSLYDSAKRRADVEDLVQEINLRLLSGALAQYDAARGTIEAFITVMAKTMAIDAWRRSQRRPIAASIEMEASERGGWDDSAGELRSHYLQANDLQDHSEDALAMLMREEQVNRLDNLIKQLDPDDQHFILVSCQDNFDSKQYAERLGVTEVALRVRKFRLGQKLRQMLLDSKS